MTPKTKREKQLWARLMAACRESRRKDILTCLLSQRMRELETDAETERECLLGEVVPTKRVELAKALAAAHAETRKVCEHQRILVARISTLEQALRKATRSR